MNHDDFSRRDVLRLGAGLGALALLPSCAADPEPFDEGQCDPAPADGATPLDADPAAATESRELFTHGVQAGSATAAGALLWSYCTDAAPKKLRVWRESGGASLLAKEVEVTPAAGYLRADVDGLAPNTLYRYAYFDAATGKRSNVGRFRTAYDDDCARALTLGATVCTNTSWGPFTSLNVLARQEFDLLVHLGDYSYNDGAVTLDEYRKKWLTTISDGGYQALNPRASFLGCWDDHEFLDSSRIYTAPPERIAAARAAFYENTPMRVGPNGKHWHSVKWGRTAEFFVLDCRTERIPSSRTSDDPIYVSKEQLAWLKDGLRKSTAHFKIVLNSVPIISFPETGWNLAKNDRWEGYGKQRAELLDHLAKNAIRNVWFLSGDLHVGLVARVDETGPAAAYWEVLVGPGANYNPLWIAYQNGTDEERESIAPPGRFAYFSGEFAATTLVFDPATDSVRVRFLDVNGKVAHDATYRQEAPAPSDG